jgi:DNA polymerase I-like protein with 3'-5' exonuclease and polymerase domains
MPKLQERIYSLDCEATGLDLMHGARPFFVSMCDQEGQISYWEADVDPLTRKPKWNPDDLNEAHRLTHSADRLVLQNPKFDFKALDTVGLSDWGPGGADWGWPWHKTFDTLMAGHLLCSNQPHDLTTMAMIYLRLNIQPLEDKLEVATKEARKIARHKYPDWQLAQEGLASMPSCKGGTKKDKKGNVKEDGKKWKYDSWLPRAIAKAEGYPQDHDWWHVLADYGNGDSAVTLPLFLKQEQLLVKQGLWKIYLEGLKLLPVIYQMEANGMTMSSSRLNELYTRLSKEVEECRAKCMELADGEIEDLPVNGMSNALRYVLFEKFALKSSKKTDTGKPSGDKFVLDHWLATLPEVSKPWQFVNSLRKYRKRKTAIGYMNAYQKFWLPLQEHTFIQKPGEQRNNGSEWRIVYPSYNSTGTDTLRFSSQNPNAQQVSKQGETNTRYCFGPAPGREWWAIDFSNLELRIPAYESGEADMVYLFEHPNDPPYFGSYHMLVFDTLHPEMFAKYGMECKEHPDVKHWYGWTKAGNFAIQYGAVEHSGTADRAYHVPGAQKRISSRFTRIKGLSKKWIDFANKTGYVETMPDKQVDPTRGYPLWCTRTNNGHILETVPLSYHVQGTAMWITRKAMVRCQAFLSEHPRMDGRLIGQVHDEMLFDFPKGIGKDHIRYLALLMERSGDDVGVPLGSTIHYHPVCWALEEKWQ